MHGFRPYRELREQVRNECGEKQRLNGTMSFVFLSRPAGVESVKTGSVGVQYRAVRLTVCRVEHNNERI